MSIIFRISVAFALTFAGNVAIATMIVDFEDVALISPDRSAIGSQTSRGFQFDPTATTNDVLLVHRNGTVCVGGSGCVDNGTQALFAFNNDGTPPFEILMTAVDNGIFNLLSFDYSELFIDSGPTNGTAEIDLVGTTSGGSTVTASFLIDQTPNTYQTANVAGFSGLTSVLFSSDTFFPTYDNIVISRVPEPTTLALMGLGIAGLGFRRKTK